MRERYRGDRLALGGGVFMNVKANMLIAGEEWVRRPLRLPVMPGTSRTRWARPTWDTCRSAGAAGVPADPRPVRPRVYGAGA